MKDNIIKDLKKRKMSVVAFIVENDEDGTMQLVSYDDEGLIKTISGKVDNIEVNERLKGRMIRPMAEITRTKGENIKDERTATSTKQGE